MKRIAFYIGIVAAMVASCSIQEEDLKTSQQEDVFFYASFEQPIYGDTKVYANENLYLRWTADDRVSIFNRNTYNQQYRFTGATGANAGGFQKVDTEEFITGNPIANVVSVYPYQESTTISEEGILSLTLPAEQHYADKTFGLGANTMVSVTADNFLQYKNVGGYLRLSLYGEGVNVSSIKLRGNNGEKLAGKATVTMSQEGTPIAVMANDVTDEITLICDPPVALGPTEEKSKDFWFVVPPVTFGKGFTITIILANGEIFTKSTSKSIVIERSSLSKMSLIEVTGCTPAAPIPEAVDLGLSVKWASFNLGASCPEEYGDYYAWGETTPKDRYDWSTYRWCNGSETTLTKYNTKSYNGVVDNKIALDPEDDAAVILLGGGWRTPTQEELQELLSNCSIVSATVNGVAGWHFISQKEGYSDKSIFLPAVGYRSGTGLYWTKTGGRWWTSSLNAENPGRAWFLFDAGWTPFYTERYYGYPIRPVFVGDGVPVESISLSEISIEIGVGKNRTLIATVLPANALDRSVSWSTSNESIAIVSSAGVVTGVADGSAVITATTNDGGKTATCNVIVREATVSIPTAVDLGLSVKWASFNLGASAPEEYGDYFAWGETEPKEEYSWATYKFELGTGSNGPFSKYVTNSFYGTVDNKSILEPEDDAAHVIWGGNWRLPTRLELIELHDSCTMINTTENGVRGLKFTSNVDGYTDKFIFIPAAGFRSGFSIEAGSDGALWSSSLDTSYPYGAYNLDFFSGNASMWGNNRFRGFSIRPVCE